MYISEHDKMLIRQLIENQLQAFQANDLATALSLTSPKIQHEFTPPEFSQIISDKYGALLKPRSVMFRGFTLVNNFPALIAMIMDREGNLVKVIFIVQHQQDYSWRVHGYELAGINEKIV
ncbi:hypothetical protein C7B62_04735 [Pleurocapsa sp. CCALA 161]|uniref:DUF4864 domain-containing protein n=1 Tax=Pleurocapsa sp. CCALA 161 TaxID=2107688 RepID=UPI000D051E12|nr:DUF4864 domain-containing protein [Pleurocapsa sp. CCALA 161]PSB11703.1 hypothetical protein C7B62_04735 [Pleurocapsa sp. CCALA 161]